MSLTEAQTVDNPRTGAIGRISDSVAGLWAFALRTRGIEFDATAISVALVRRPLKGPHFEGPKCHQYRGKSNPKRTLATNTLVMKLILLRCDHE